MDESERHEALVWLWTLGLVASALGYAAMLSTAALFPTWRSERLHRVWLHYCGTSLLQLFIDFYVDAEEARLDFAEMYPLIVISVTLIEVSFCWTLAASWFAHQKLVRVFEQPGEWSVAKWFAFVWGAPVACQGSLQLIKFAGNRFGLAQEQYRYVVGGVTLLLVGAVCAGNVALYAHVLYEVFRSKLQHGRADARANLRYAAICFILFLMSGVHSFAILIPLVVARLDIEMDFNVDLAFKTFEAFRVPAYSLIVIFGVRVSRALWWDFFQRRKYWGSDV